ncbi:hypothetical protein ACIBEF_04940 [Micromonospora sp. NPDC050795]|uniref:hypothetical protein n=1 Tax=Micromonospora sp. NPDC050795 TaxID=3364282 RepID=UPI00378FD8EF
MRLPPQEPHAGNASHTSIQRQRGLQGTARLAAVALTVWAVVDIVRTILMMGHYENRIEVITHGNVDVAPVWYAYMIVSQPFPTGFVTVAADRLWMLASLVAVAVVVIWQHYVRRTAQWLGDAVRWPPALTMWTWFVAVLGTVVLHLLSWRHRRATADGGAFHETWLDTRSVAYPLWSAATVLVVVTAALSVRVVRRTARAQDVFGPQT